VLAAPTGSSGQAIIAECVAAAGLAGSGGQIGIGGQAAVGPVGPIGVLPSAKTHGHGQMDARPLSLSQQIGGRQRIAGAVPLAPLGAPTYGIGHL
jgi:hypothetical protein